MWRYSGECNWKETTIKETGKKDGVGEEDVSRREGGKEGEEKTSGEVGEDAYSSTTPNTTTSTPQPLTPPLSPREGRAGVTGVDVAGTKACRVK